MVSPVVRPTSEIKLNIEIIGEHLEQAGFPQVPVMFAALALVFWLMRPADSSRLYHTSLFYGLALCGQVVTALLTELDIGLAADVLREAFVIMAGIAVIRLWGAALFRLFLPMVRLHYAGLDLSQIVTTSAVITAVIALSMQDTLGNILGGLAIQLDGSLEVGDWVHVDDVTGKVSDISWRSVSIETNNWETVVIPNGQLMKSKFVVLARRAACDCAALVMVRW